MKFKCYLCEGLDYSVRAKSSQIRFNCCGSSGQFLECLNCGLVQFYPAWSDEEMDKLYCNYNSKIDFCGYKPKKEIRSYIDKLICGKKKTLEVGCGRGDNLIRQISRGYDVVGIDKDVSVCDGKRILNFDFENFESDTKYDFIYAIHVFEHIKNPDKFISLIKKHLADEGEFAIEIPSVRDPLISLYNNNSYQKFYWYPFHMYYYDMDNITNLFGKNGIKVNITLIQRYGIFNHLRWIILGKPGNLNPHIPILDDVYKFVLTKIIKKSDTMLIRGNR